MTHYLAAFVTVSRDRAARIQQAVCGAFIGPGDHSREPECSTCAAWLAQDTTDDRSGEDLFGTPDPALIVAPEPDRDVVGEYETYMRRNGR